MLLYPVSNSRLRTDCAAEALAIIVLDRVAEALVIVVLDRAAGALDILVLEHANREDPPWNKESDVVKSDKGVIFNQLPTGWGGGSRVPSKNLIYCLRFILDSPQKMLGSPVQGLSQSPTSSMM